MNATALLRAHRAFAQLERDGVRAPESEQSLRDLARAGGHDVRRNVREIRRAIGQDMANGEWRAAIARSLAHLRIILGPSSVG